MLASFPSMKGPAGDGGSQSLEEIRAERDRLLQLAAVGEVLPSVLHELRNPVTAIATAVEALLEELPPSRIQEDLHAVLSEVRRIRFTLDGVSVVSQSLRGGRDVAVDFCLMEAFRLFEPQLARRGVTGRCEVSSLPLLPVDGNALRTVVLNLLTNAGHACDPGDEVVLTASLAAGGRLLTVSVSDSGCGMDQATLARCQELFFTTKPTGSGIGLPLCRMLAERAGGTLRVESAPSAGTRVTLEVPIAIGGGAGPSPEGGVPGR